MSGNDEHIPFNKNQGDFGLPEGYFGKSAASIANKIEWQEEHRDFKTLLSLKNKPGFTVPNNYFTGLEGRLELLAYERLSGIERKTGFAVPGHYFEEQELKELSATMLNRENELEAFAKLSSIKKQNNFKVDGDYFTISQARLRTLLNKEQGSTKMFSLFNVKLPFAVAALLVAALGIWTYSYYFKTVDIQDCGTIACIDRTDLVKTRDLENMDDEDLFEIVDPSALEKKLNNEKNNDNIKAHADSGINKAVSDELLDEL